MVVSEGALEAPFEIGTRRLASTVGFVTAIAFLTATVSLVFALLHRRLAIDADAAYAQVNPLAVSIHPGRDAITFSFGPFLAVLLGSIVLAALRHRIAAFAVFLLAAAVPLLQAALGVLPVDRPRSFRVAPAPLGAFWTTGTARPPLGPLWRAFAIDYGLALLPALAIVLWAARPLDEPRAARRARGSSSTIGPTAAALASSVFLYWLVLHTWELHETLRGANALHLGSDLVAFAPFFALGLVLSTGSRWRFAALGGVPVLWSTLWIPTLIAGGGHTLTGTDVHDALPFLAVVAAGALWHPIATALDRDHAPTWTLVVALNVLNLADVLFTSAALRSHEAVEANPIAAVIGPGVKLVGVAVASVLLARFRPRALLWLVLALALVIAWHLSGLLLDTA